VMFRGKASWVAMGEMWQDYKIGIRLRRI